MIDDHGGLPGTEFHNVRHDPSEKYGQRYLGLLVVTPAQNTLRDHMILIWVFPSRQAEADAAGRDNAQRT
jgi:arylsulfatase